MKKISDYTDEEIKAEILKDKSVQDILKTLNVEISQESFDRVTSIDINS